MQEKSNINKTLGKIVLYFKAEIKAVILLLIMSSIAVCALILAPVIQANAVDAIVGGNFDTLPKILYKLLFVFLLYPFINLLQGILSAKLSQRIIFKLRNDIFNKIINMPVAYVDTHSHGDLMSRITNDTDNISNVISSSLSSLFSGILTIIGTLLIMFYYNVPLTLLCCITLFGTIIFTKLYSGIVSKYFAKRQEILGKINGTIKETITNYRTITAYNAQDIVIKNFEETSDELTKIGIIAETAGGIMNPILNMLGNASFGVAAVFGGYFALKGDITIGVLSAFLIYAKQLSMPINKLAFLFSSIASAFAGAERIFHILEQEEENKSGKNLKNNISGLIEFKNINFSYVPEKQIIKDFNLTIQAGEKVALVGSTGSGKTTIVNLLMRFYDTYSGGIFLDGTDIKNIAIDDLRATIGIVLQDAVLFSDTIKNNLTYANDKATEEEIIQSAGNSCCAAFINNLPDGYNTVLSETATNISQGEKQLLTIGRTFLSYPQILILDEATSNVDTRTEKNIQKAMNRLMQGRTSIIIAHRLSTIRNADKIIVMDNGQIVEQGTHNELLGLKGKYYELYMTQFAGNEI